MSDSTRKGKRGDRVTYANYARKTARLYDDIADWYVRTFWDDRTDDDWIKVCLGCIPRSSLVGDVGSGPGNYARHFIDAGHRVICLDVSAKMVEAAREQLGTRLGVVSDMRQLPIASGALDCVFCAYSLNHIVRQDMPRTIQEFGRTLRDRGLVCLFLKVGNGEYIFSASGDSSSRGVMSLFGENEILDAIHAVRIRPLTILEKDTVSKHEFSHRKMLVVGIKA